MKLLNEIVADLMGFEEVHDFAKQASTRKATAKEIIIRAFRKMNIQSLEQLKAEDLLRTESQSGFDLLARLKAQFENLRVAGNTELIPAFGRCAGACGNSTGFRFEGNKTGARLTYIIFEDEEGKCSLKHCISFQVPGEPEVDPF